MKGFLARLSLGLLVLGLTACGTFFDGGSFFGGPTVLVARENFSFQSETDQDGNTTYTYAYEILLYALPGSGVGYVTLLDAAGNPVESPFLISRACPISSVDPCGPYPRAVTKRSGVLLPPFQVVQYQTATVDGQSKIVRLPTPIELY